MKIKLTPNDILESVYDIVADNASRETVDKMNKAIKYIDYDKGLIYLRINNQQFELNVKEVDHL